MLDPTDFDLNEETLLAWKTARETRPPDTHTNELLLLISARSMTSTSKCP